MESQYEKLKRPTLKDLLESWGRIASNQPWRDLIADLLELDEPDRTTEMAKLNVSNLEEDETLHIVQ
ncbi:Hypothetical predicted protein, partial [Pelobates cultripes]